MYLLRCRILIWKFNNSLPQHKKCNYNNYVEVISFGNFPNTMLYEILEFKTAQQCSQLYSTYPSCKSLLSRKRSTPSSGHASTDTRRHSPRSEGTTFTVRGGDLGGDETMSDQSPDGGFPVYTLGSPSPNPITLTLDVNGQRLPMQLDTGAAVSLISTRTHKRLFPRCPLAKTSITLSTYTGERMNVAGRLQVKAEAPSLPL